MIPVETREELVSLLCEAAELEHGLACSYLFAAFSLKRSEADGLSRVDLEAVDRWRKTIMHVAEEEMLHLALVSNLLTALGAAPHLWRPAFPQASRYYPAGVTIGLHRFEEQTLTRFIFLERPEEVDAEPDVKRDPLIDTQADVPVAAPGALLTADDEQREAADPASYSTVGHLYEAIEGSLCALVEARGERDVFLGPPPAQASSAYFRLADLRPVTDLASARAALETLTTQGEGLHGDWTEAHYGKFLAVRDEFRTFRASDPAFDPAWPVMANPLVDSPPDGGQDGDDRVVRDPHTLAVMRLSNGCYTLMTAMLLRFFAHTDDSEDALRTLSQASVDLMEGAIGPLGTLLAKMPVGAECPGATADASFEFYRAITLLPHRRAAWLVFRERLIELGTHAAVLANDEGIDVLHEVGDALANTAAHLWHDLSRAPSKE